MVFSLGFGSPDPSVTPDLMSAHPTVTLAVPSAEGALISSSISSFIYFRALAQLDTPMGLLFWSLLAACSCS